MKIAIKLREPDKVPDKVPDPILLIDYRETGLKKLCEDNHIPHESRNLDVGDIIIERDGNPLIIMERKTLNDLASSIRDGRHREQKARLLATQASRRIYLIEQSNVYQFSLSTLESAMLNTLIRDGLGIYQTRSLQHTFEVVSKIFSKSKEFTEILENGREHIDYVKTIEIKKRDNQTASVCWTKQLASIPGVSVNFAGKIVENYQTMASLVQSYVSLEEKKRAGMLQDIIVGSRKLGPVLSKRIHAYVFGIENCENV